MTIIATIFLPLFSSIFCGLLNKQLSHKQASIVSITLICLSAFCASIVFIETGLNNKIIHVILHNWISSGELKVNWSIYIDQLSSLMLLMVVWVSTFVHIYSIGYMHDDPALPQFMSYLSLFTFFMLLLISSDNFIQLFCGWEGVGLCSYLLIGFWYKKLSATKAAKKAFIVNRIADFAFILAICLIFTTVQSVEFNKVFISVNTLKDQYLTLNGYNLPLLELICILILIGCMGKSAQIGFHVWLPDAMEGPTPVSALIHAATMVTAGVFMLARCSYLFEYTEIALNLITIVGSTTCIFAATIAITQNDIKRIIAYSTCSQLGYMFFACGVSAYHAGMFHLFTHAYFKALLFLGAGNIIHATFGEQDIRNMGGLWKKLPITYSFFWIGSIAISGLFPLSGFFSKDLILESAYSSNTTVGRMAFWLGIITAGLTAIYSWRLIILVFHGKPNMNKNKYKKVHELPMNMLSSMLALAFCTLLSGIYGVYRLNISEIPGYFSNSIFIHESHMYDIHNIDWYIKTLPTFVSIAGIIVACILYNKPDLVNALSIIFKPIYILSLNKYYIDEIYNTTIIQIYKIKTRLAKILDTQIIDKFGPDGAACFFKEAAKYISKLQTGFIFSYAFFMLTGLVIPITWSLKTIL